MKPIEFPEQNVVFAKDQPEYQPLPAFKDSGPEGVVVSCWQLTYKERIRILLTGKLWSSMMTFHRPLTPSFLSTQKSEVLTVPQTSFIEKMKSVFQFSIRKSAFRISHD